jgi:SH3-like domain-containing protein
MQKLILVCSFIFFSFVEFSYAKNEYFRTLRNDKVNLRQGPSFEYPVKIIYKKKFLPVIVNDSSGNFRKIKDHENNSGWIHLSQLSKKKAAIVTAKEIIMFKKATMYSTPIVILQEGRLIHISKCKKKWCKVKSDNYKGWVKKKDLWGLF